MEKTKSVPFNGTQEQEAMLHAVIDELREDKGCLMPIMQKAQEIYGYLPYEPFTPSSIYIRKDSTKFLYVSEQPAM